jgi:cardiolipin synthase A/B
MDDQSVSDTRASSPIRAHVDGNRLEVLETGRARFDALLELIGSAKKNVRLLFYIFNSDRSGHAVRDALVAAARRGVHVRLLLDGYGCSAAEPNFFAPVADEGGDLCVFHPRYGRRYLVRNHQKLAIADDRIAIIGGANIHDSYLSDEGPKHWRDLWLSVEGPAVRAASRYFDSVYRWTTTKGAKLRNLRKIVFRHSQSRGPLQWKFSGPLSRRNSWPAALARELASASRLDLIAAYFAPPPSLMRRLRRLGRRGKVRIITAAKSDNNATIAAARHTYSRLLRRGVEMYEYRPARLHTKLAILEDVVHVGSANFDFRSVYINLEIMLRIEDADFAAAMRRYFEHELRDSQRITLALHRKRANPWRRLKWTISHWLVTTMDYTVTRRLNFNER